MVDRPVSTLEMDRMFSSWSLEQRQMFLEKKHKSLPRFLYRYRPAHESKQYIGDVAIRGWLHMSHPQDFNDPYDCAAKHDFSGSKTDWRYRLKRVFKIGNYSSSEEAKLVRQAVKDRVGSKSRLKTAFHSSIQELGIVCFSANPDHLLMWSHYGKNHEGFCWVIDPAKDSRATLYKAIKVQYQDDLPVFKHLQRNYENQFPSVLTTKFSAWCYEEEHRFIETNRQIAEAKKMYFHPDAIVGIIFGARCSDETKQKVRRVLNERLAKGLDPVDEYQAVMKSDKYKLEITAVN